MLHLQRFNYGSLVLTLLLYCLSSGLQAATPYRFATLWPQLQQPWYFSKPSSLVFGADNEFYVADSGNHRIQVFHQDGSFLRGFGSAGATPGLLNQPTGLAIRGAEVFVADSRNHRIQVYNKDSGQFLRGWGKLGQQAGDFNVPFGIAVSAVGQVFCVDSLNHRVQVFDLTGKFLLQWGGQGTAEGQFYTPQGIVTTSNGEVYIVDSGNHRIQVFNSSGKFLRAWGGKGDTDGKFFKPYGISLTRTGQIIVADTLNNRVQIFDNSGRFISSWGQSGANQGDFNSPYAAVETPNGDFIVADTSNNRLQVFNPQRSFIHNWSSFSDKPGDFKGLYHAAVSPMQEVYVADLLNHRIQVFSVDGVFKRSWGKQGSATGEFQWPSAIAFNSAGEVLVVDSGNNRIQVFNSQGQYLRSWGQFGSENGSFYYPKGLAVSANGNVFVSDSSNYRIQVFNAAGEFLLAWGSAGKENGQFESPYGIAIGSTGEVFVTDPWNYRIQVFSQEGKFLRSWGSYGTDPGQLNRPYNITADAAGHLYVSDTYNHRVQIFTTQGQFVEQLGEFGSLPGQFSYPSAVALDPQNTLFVVDQNNNRLQVFKQKTTTSTSRHPFKAILLAGGGPSQGNFVNNIWDATQLLSNKAYNTLRSQGFAKTEVKYLTAGNTEIDLDNNNIFDDLENATQSSLKQAITQWAGDAEEVFIYLIDHGGDGSFQINPHELLSASQLDTWLTQLQTQIPGRVTLVVESCRAGSFLSKMSRPKRLTITSSNAQQPAIVSNNGLNSFSYYFWSELRSGALLQEAFKTARQGMSSQLIENRPQMALLDSNGDGEFSSEDYDVLGDYCVGNCAQYASAAPKISSSSGNSVLNGEQSLNFQITFNSLEAVNSAWVVIRPPDFLHSDLNQPVSELPKVYLQCNSQKQCSGSYDKFTLPGEYSLSFFALDDKYQLSLPEQRTVTQQGGATADNSSPASYQATTQILRIADVQVGETHYQMQLKRLDSKVFLLNQAEEIISVPSKTAARFDSQQGTLNIPSVIFAGQSIPVVLHYIGDFKFELVTESKSLVALDRKN